MSYHALQLLFSIMPSSLLFLVCHFAGAAVAVPAPQASLTCKKADGTACVDPSGPLPGSSSTTSTSTSSPVSVSTVQSALPSSTSSSSFNVAPPSSLPVLSVSTTTSQSPAASSNGSSFAFNFATSTSPTSNTTNPAYSDLPDKSQVSGSWENAQCTGDITNAAAPVATRWAQADADNAFSYASWVFQNDKVALKLVPFHTYQPFQIFSMEIQI